jgi:hypothetical protein
MAARETDPTLKQEYLEQGARWSKLAANCEFSERLNSWISRLGAEDEPISAWVS